MKNRLLTLIFALFWITLVVFSQENDKDIVGVYIPIEKQEAQGRVELSKSRANYPVSPGDVYVLSYNSAGKKIVDSIIVESDYTLNLSVFGKLNTEGLTFPELKAKVERIITSAYPNSLPYLSLSSVGMFQVYLKGEVPQTKFVTAWGLTRLSEIVLDNVTPYSSTRDVRVLSKTGRERTYDLFKALYRGAVEENPFVGPGDTIVVHRREREIELRGEVLKPGKYQLISGEGVEEIFQYYGGGFTVLADQSRVRVLRVSSETPRVFHLNLRGGYSELGRIEDGDVLTVPSKIAKLPVVVFEGAISSGDRAATYSRLTHIIAEGDTLYDAVLAVKDSILTAANLAGAYLVRQDADRTIPVDLESLLFRYDPEEDLVLQPGDRVVIPRKQYYVSVIGVVKNAGIFDYVPQQSYSYYLTLAEGVPPSVTPNTITIVNSRNEPRPLDAAIQPEDRIIVTESLIPVVGGVYAPGSYPFIPAMLFSHYIDLAGGINPELNSCNRVTIRNWKGKRLKNTTLIQPGDKIYVPTNDFLYNFGKYFPLITSGVAFVTAAITLVNYFAPK